VERGGPGGDAKAHEGIARLHTGRCIDTLPCVGRWYAGAGAGRSGIMISTMRKPLVAVGAGDHCPPKLRHQPCMLACPVPTQIALRAFAPFKIFNTKAHRDLADVPEIARVRCQCLRLQFGSVGIGSGVYVCL